MTVTFTRKRTGSEEKRGSCRNLSIRKWDEKRKKKKKEALPRLKNCPSPLKKKVSELVDWEPP
jgi:hypothetical protein